MSVPLMEDTMAPLDRGLNVAILHITSKLYPCGFDVAPNASLTFPALIAQFDQRKRVKVCSEDAENTIYADPEVTYAFRAWHDWCHWRGRLDFSLDSELAVWRMHCAQIIGLYDDNARTRRWSAILYAEIVGHLHHHRRRRCAQEQRQRAIHHSEAAHVAAPYDLT